VYRVRAILGLLGLSGPMGSTSRTDAIPSAGTAAEAASAAGARQSRKQRWLPRSAAALVAMLLGVVSLAGVALAGPANPVIIVAGTFAGQPVAPIFYAPLAKNLRDDGHETHIFALPGFGLGDIRDSAAKLNALSDKVRAESGASRVNLIGHSQGGLVARYYIKSLGGAGEVENMISLAAPHRGTTTASLLKFLGLGTCLGVTACQQMSIGSDFLNELNAGDDTIGDVRYTNVVTVMDELVIPYTNGFLDAADGNNANVTVQRQCPVRFVDHIFLPLDAAVYSGIEDALAGEPVTLRC
jgi:triacylglycerol lipase